MDIPDDEWTANVAAWRRAQELWDGDAAPQDPFGHQLDASNPGDHLSMDDGARSRMVYAAGDRPPRLTVQAPGSVPLAAPAPPTQLSGLTVTAPRPVKQPAPLTGRPGPADIVARTLNTIAAGPNSAGPLPRARLGPIGATDGRLARGAGSNVHGEAQVGIPGFKQSIGADGTLDPPSGRPEVSFSGIKGKGVDLPPRVRVLTTPTGELDVELTGPMGYGPISVPKGTYVIGTPDRPRSRK
jgi:hypothetical protein